MTTAVLTAPDTRPALSREPGPGRWRRWWRPALLIGGVGVAVVSLRGRVPDLASTWAALRPVAPVSLFGAATLQLVSMSAFAEQQRHLLRAFGVRVGAGESLRVSYTRSALAIAVPGGSAVSAGYALRRFRGSGASPAVATAVMLLSGIASAVGLALLYAGDLATLATPTVTGTGLAATGAVALVVRRRGRRSADAPPVVPVPDRTASTDLRWVGKLRATLHDTARLARAVPPGRWATVIGLAILNWLTDLATLYVVVTAVGLTVPVTTVATAYLVAQLVRQIPLTPGGLGTVEASLVLALVTAGAPVAAATAAVLLYRLLSYWSILPIGLACWGWPRRSMAGGART